MGLEIGFGFGVWGREGEGGRPWRRERGEFVIVIVILTGDIELKNSDGASFLFFFFSFFLSFYVRLHVLLCVQYITLH